MASEQVLGNKIEAHNRAEKPMSSACPDFGISFDRESLSAVQFNKLDRNGKETSNLLTDSFAGDLAAPQKNLFKNVVMDSMQEKVGSLSKLAQPENAAAASKFAEMMNNGGFDVVINKAGAAGSPLASLSIFEKGDTEGMRFNAVQSGK